MDGLVLDVKNGIVVIVGNPITTPVKIVVLNPKHMVYKNHEDYQI
jgi:hypothetical protein